MVNPDKLQLASSDNWCHILPIDTLSKQLFPFVSLHTSRSSEIGSCNLSKDDKNFENFMIYIKILLLNWVKRMSKWQALRTLKKKFLNKVVQYTRFPIKIIYRSNKSDIWQYCIWYIIIHCTTCIISSNVPKTKLVLTFIISFYAFYASYTRENFTTIRETYIRNIMKEKI